MKVNSQNTYAPNFDAYTASSKSATKSTSTLKPCGNGSTNRLQEIGNLLISTGVAQKITNYMPFTDLPSLASSSRLGYDLAKKSLHERLETLSVPQQNSTKKIAENAATEDVQIKKWLSSAKEKYKNDPVFKQFMNQIFSHPETQRNNYNYGKVLEILAREELNITPNDLVDIGLCTTEEIEKIVKEGKFSNTKQCFLNQNFLGFFAHGKKISLKAFFNIDDHFIEQGIVNIYKESAKLDQKKFFAYQYMLEFQECYAGTKVAFAEQEEYSMEQERYFSEQVEYFKEQERYFSEQVEYSKKKESHFSEQEKDFIVMMESSFKQKKEMYIEKKEEFSKKQKDIAGLKKDFIKGEKVIDGKIHFLQEEYRKFEEFINEYRDIKNASLKNIFTSNMFDYAHLYHKDHLHPLHWATELGNEKYVTELLDAGMPIDEVDEQKDGGGLHGALLKRNFELLEDFMSYGANPLLKDRNKKFPLHIATESRSRTDDGKLNVIKLFTQNITSAQLYEQLLLLGLDGSSVLQNLASNGNLKSFEYLIEKLEPEHRLKLLEEFRTSQDWSILSQAAQHCRYETIQLLLENCPIDKRKELLLMRDKNNKWTPLYIAARANKPQILENLIQGFNSEQVYDLITEAAGIDKYGKNIFHMLFDTGIKNNPDNLISLEYVIKNLNPENLKILLEQEDNTKDKNTPLKLAEKNGYLL